MKYFKDLLKLEKFDAHTMYSGRLFHIHIYLVRNIGMVEGICSRERLPEDERSSGVCKVGIRRYNTGREKAQTMNNLKEMAEL